MAIGECPLSKVVWIDKTVFEYGTSYLKIGFSDVSLAIDTLFAVMTADMSWLALDREYLNLKILTYS
jgi:hypothetical protein